MTKQLNTASRAKVADILLHVWRALLRVQAHERAAQVPASAGQSLTNYQMGCYAAVRPQSLHLIKIQVCNSS